MRIRAILMMLLMMTTTTHAGQDVVCEPVNPATGEPCISESRTEFANGGQFLNFHIANTCPFYVRVVLRADVKNDTPYVTDTTVRSQGRLMQQCYSYCSNPEILVYCSKNTPANARRVSRPDQPTQASVPSSPGVGTVKVEQDPGSGMVDEKRQKSAREALCSRNLNSCSSHCQKQYKASLDNTNTCITLFCEKMSDRCLGGEDVSNAEWKKAWAEYLKQRGGMAGKPSGKTAKLSCQQVYSIAMSTLAGDTIKDEFDERFDRDMRAGYQAGYEACLRGEDFETASDREYDRRFKSHSAAQNMQTFFGILGAVGGAAANIAASRGSAGGGGGSGGYSQGSSGRSSVPSCRSSSELKCMPGTPCLPRC